MTRAAPTREPRKDPVLSTGISAGRVQQSGEYEDSAHGSSLDRFVKRVPLDRRAASIADEFLDVRPRHSSAGWSTCAVNDALFDDRTVEVVSAETQRDLRQ